MRRAVALAMQRLRKERLAMRMIVKTGLSGIAVAILAVMHASPVRAADAVSFAGKTVDRKSTRLNSSH